MLTAGRCMGLALLICTIGTPAASEVIGLPLDTIDGIVQYIDSEGLLHLQTIRNQPGKIEEVTVVKLWAQDVDPKRIHEMRSIFYSREVRCFAIARAKHHLFSKCIIKLVEVMPNQEVSKIYYENIADILNRLKISSYRCSKIELNSSDFVSKSMKDHFSCR